MRQTWACVLALLRPLSGRGRPPQTPPVARCSCSCCPRTGTRPRIQAPARCGARYRGSWPPWAASMCGELASRRARARRWRAARRWCSQRSRTACGRSPSSSRCRSRSTKDGMALFGSPSPCRSFVTLWVRRLRMRSSRSPRCSTCLSMAQWPWPPKASRAIALPRNSRLYEMLVRITERYERRRVSAWSKRCWPSTTLARCRS
mmetsp:Transcript_28737/g.95464  ORF Transcript_28737/g.95464 Transcript_28737/m.95464 type:complete len:204 (-) Transcript_28737:2052-2663(-)